MTVNLEVLDKNITTQNMMMSLEMSIKKILIFQFGVLFAFLVVSIYSQPNRNSRLNDVTMIAKRRAVQSCQKCKIDRKQCLNNEDMQSVSDKFLCLRMCNGKCKLLDQVRRSMARRMRYEFPRRNFISRKDLIETLSG